MIKIILFYKRKNVKHNFIYYINMRYTALYVKYARYATRNACGAQRSKALRIKSSAGLEFNGLEQAGSYKT